MSETASRSFSMSAPAIKPGTRCECRDHSCPEARESVPNAHREDHEKEFGIKGGTGFQRCTRDAVRLVTVPRANAGRSLPHVIPVQVPMCSPCAAHAERGAK